MPEMHDVADGGPRIADDVMQIVNTWLGRSGKGVPLRQVSVNDQNLYAVRAKNIDPVNGLAFLAEGPGGIHLAEATRTGFTYSSDGVNSGLVPVSQSAAETISGAKTFAAPAVLNGQVTLGTTVLETSAPVTPSVAGTLTLPPGRKIPISGSNIITNITAGAADRTVVLRFLAAGCRVKVSSTVRLNGDYLSVIGGTLTLESDGTNWNEVCRGAGARPGARYRLSAATTSIVSGAERTVAWTATDFNYGLPTVSVPAPVSAIVLGIVGRWRVSGETGWDDSGAANFHKGYLLKNGSDYLKLFGWASNANNPDDGFPFGQDFEVTSITDSYGLGLTTANTTNLLGGANDTNLTFTYLGL